VIMDTVFRMFQEFRKQAFGLRFICDGFVGCPHSLLRSMNGEPVPLAV